VERAATIATRLVARTDAYLADELAHEQLRTGNDADWREAQASEPLHREVQRQLRAQLGGAS